MKKGNIAAWRYLWKVGGWLPCSGKLKREIMARIKTVLDDYLNDHPDADFAELSHRFGTPQQIAASYIEEMNVQDLLKQLRIRRKIICIVVATAVTLVLLWAGAVTTALIRHINDMNGYLVVSEAEVIDRWEIETDPTTIPFPAE